MGSVNPYNGFSGAQRDRAQRWLNREIKAGRLLRPTTCDACGASGCRVDMHAEDYSEPFGAHTRAHSLCFVCHMMVHCRFRCPGRWLDYVAMVGSGMRVEPQPTSFGAFAKHFLGASGAAGFVQGDAPARFPLRTIGGL